jgi:hypothetical protein
MTTGRKSPWARIVLAYRRGTGVRLSAEDVDQLSYDDAIMKRGALDLQGVDDEDALDDGEDDDETP